MRLIEKTQAGGSEMTMRRLVCSIVIPVRNEAKNITKCLDAIVSNDYPKDKLEIIVVDAQSTDNTLEVLQNYSNAHPDIKITVLQNLRKITSSGLNIGVKNAQGSIIAIIGAHNFVSSNYLSVAIRYLEDNEVDCVGGIGICIPTNERLIQKGISLVINSKFGAGGSFRTKYPKKVMDADTVPSPIYKREVFQKIGFFNEELVRSQDMDFNLRLKKAGGKILLVPEIVSYYYARSNLKAFGKHNFADGVWAIYPLKFGSPLFRLRHLVPLVFVLSLIGSAILSLFFPIFWWLFLFIVGLYFLANTYFSVRIAIREKSANYLFIMPIVFATRHISYGLGSIFGLIKALISKRFWMNLLKAHKAS